MSRRSSIVILTVTLTVTLFVMALTLVINPEKGNDYALQILEAARTRQGQALVSVTQPLETNIEVLREEDKMAEKVSEIIVNDGNFINTIESTAAYFVKEKIDSVEVEAVIDPSIYSSLEAIEGSVVKLEGSIASTERSVDGLDSKITTLLPLEGEVNALSEEVKSIPRLTESDIAKALLEDEAFLNALVEEVNKRSETKVNAEELAQAIVSSPTFSSYVESINTAAPSIPIPIFDSIDEKEYSEEEYLIERNLARNSEIEKILSFLGY